MIEPEHIATGGRPLTLTADDGWKLGATLFEARSAKTTVVIHAGTAVPQRFYLRFAAHLARRGHQVLTYDYRGVGASRPDRLRGFDATMSDWGNLDAPAAHRAARQHAGSKPVVSLGHSFGGQLVGLSDEVHDVAFAFFVGAQLGWVGHWPLFEQLRLRAIWGGAVPALTAAFGYLPGRAGLGVDLPSGVARQWAEWATHPDYLAGHVPDAAARFARFRAPAVLYSFTDDDYAPRVAVDRFRSRLLSSDVTHRRLAPADAGLTSIGHFGFFRAGAEDSLWREAVTILDAVAEARPLPVASSSPHAWKLEASDIRADLEYGRD